MVLSAAPPTGAPWVLPAKDCRDIDLRSPQHYCTGASLIEGIGAEQQWLGLSALVRRASAMFVGSGASTDAMMC